ncbi:MAG: hypothetical protein MI807_19335 [Verrucomicrobiales bacterium]|nr:hypothetical protein [Verrucomicrobiales bacterium]
MNPQIEIPDFLSPGKGAGGIGSFRLLGIYDLVDRFAREFQINHEIAFASLLAGFGHSVGGAFEIDSTLGIIRPPFSLLLVTPETDAVWPRIPIRFLVDDFEHTMRLFAKANLHQSTEQKDDAENETHHPIADRIANTVDTAKAVYADKVSERITSASLEMPFPRVPFDHHVLLTTPPVGPCRALRQLSPDNRIRFEHALSSNTPLGPSVGEVSGAAPNLYWQVEQTEARRMVEENPWFTSLPTLILEADRPGVSALAPDGSVAGEIHRRCLDLFVMRHHAMLRSTTFAVESKPFQPVYEFLTAAQKWESRTEEPSPIRPSRVVELALRFALLFTVLDKKPKPDLVAAFYGLELAKRLYTRHLKTLTKLLPIPVSHVPDTDGLSKRELAVFMRICERPGLTRSELGRTFKKLNQPERDRVLASLIGRQLIELRDGKVYRSHSSQG